MTGFRGWTEDDQIVDPLTPQTLRPLLLAAVEFVIVDNPGWGPEFFAQAARSGSEHWQVEVRLGSESRHLQTFDVNTDAAFDIIRSWAAGDGWWEDAFTWTLLPTA
ncbi:MAG TPA: hypothetical protein VIT20_11300 [Propionibacteriaceae bacterium]